MSDARLPWARFVGGIVSGSLALIANALHSLNDVASLGLALFARPNGRRPAGKPMSLGYGCAEVLAGPINLATLAIVGFYLLVGAVTYDMETRHIDGWTVVIVPGIALFITFISAACVFYRGLLLMPKTVRLLMGAVPDDVEYGAIVATPLADEGVRDLHPACIRSLGEHKRALEAHLVPHDGSLQSFEEGEAASSGAMVRPLRGRTRDDRGVPRHGRLARRRAPRNGPALAARCPELPRLTPGRC